MMNIKFLLPVFLMSAYSLCSQQYPLHGLKDHFRDVGQDIVYIAKSPASWQLKDYTIIGIGAAGIGLSIAGDEFLRRKLYGHHHPFADALATGGELMGNIWVAGSGLALCYGVSALSGNDRFRYATWQAGKSVALGVVTSLLLKNILLRERPYVGEHPHRWFRGDLFNDRTTSFPSTHATIAFALAGAFSEYYQDKGWVGPVSYSLATLSAWSRVYEGEHWFSDVLAGAVLGTLISKAVVRNSSAIEWGVAPSLNGSFCISLIYRP